MSQPIAIVGASARAAAASAIRAGFQPVAADLFADADLRAIATATRISPYPEGLLDWLRVIEPSAWMYTGALENYPELVDQMAWIAPLWGNPGDVLQAVRSPLELSAALGGAGLLFPETRESAEGLPRDGSWLAKTYRGASGSGVREFVGWVESHETHQLRRQSVGLAKLDPPYELSRYFQQRIAGSPCAAVFVAMDNTSILLGVTRQLVGDSWLGAHGFQYAGSIGPLTIDADAEKAIARIGEVLTKHFDLLGLFGVDFILNGNEVWTLEVNPRYTASVEIVERMTGVRAVKAHANACAGLRIEELPQSEIRNPKSAMPRCHGKAILFARHDFMISTDFAEWSLAEAARSPWPTLADVSPAGTRIEAGRPILTVFAEGTTSEGVEQRLRQRVAEIEQRVYADPLNSD